MAHPTQDMDISSSFTLSDNLLSNNPSTNFHDNKVTMDERNEVNLVQMHNEAVNVSKRYENQELSDNHVGDIKACENVFPWLNKFNKLMCSSVGHRSFQLLKHLLSLYTQNILTSINTYCERKLDAIKLKDHLSRTLIFFHLYWHDIKEHVNDWDLYLNEMSILLGIYIDMELKTFKHSVDCSKIASKLLSALWIYLCNSETHIFRVLLKLTLVAKKYSEIYDLLLMRSFNSLKKSVESLRDTDYVRYLLILKLWNRMKENVEDKKEVNKMALRILGPSIPKMRDELSKIIPKPPTGHETKTIWLLQPHIFDLNNASYNFVLFEEKMSTEFRYSNLRINSNFNLQSLQNILNLEESFTNYELKETRTTNTRSDDRFANEIKCDNVTERNSELKKQPKLRKYKSVSKLKPGEVILIDLTEDELNINKKEKRRKGARKLEWLKMMKKKHRIEKGKGGVKCTSQVEIADAHSTANSENFTDKALLERLPISDNIVSESTESCTFVDQKTLQNNAHSHYASQGIQDYSFNKRSNDLKCMFQHKQCDTSPSSQAPTDIQRNKILYLLKLLNTVGENIKEPRRMLNLLRENRDEDVMSCKHFCQNRLNESSELNTQSKEELFPQQKSSVETMFSSNECQNNNTESIKQELPTNTDCSMSDGDTYCQNDYRLCDVKSITSQSLPESAKQKVPRDSHECTGCCRKIETKSFFYHNNTILSTIKSEDVTKNAIDNVTDKKSICDKNIICMLSDLDKCVDVLNRIGEHIMTVHAEKQRLGCSDKTDVCDVSTTVSGSQTVESSSDWMEHINSLTNSEKLSKIIELYGKNDMLNKCNCRDSHREDSQESSTLLNQVKCEIDDCQKVTVSTSQSNDYHSFGKDNTICPEGKSPSRFTYNNIKSEFDQPIKKEDSGSAKILPDNSQKPSNNKNSILISNQISDTESPLYDPKHTKESNCDVQYSSQKKSNRTKTCSVDEFENVDILDSILNGGITLEDEQEIWEGTHSPLMSPINYDNSSSALNCITELFSQSEHAFANETEEKYIVSDTENSQTPLPECSFATTGLLNSLFDFDLTNMDSPSSDFMYSGIQTVNPRLIKKNFTDEGLLKKNCTSELYTEENMLASETHDLETVPFLQREKEMCSNKNILIDSSVNVVGFGLISNREEVLEFPPRNKSVSSFSGQSTVLVNSDNISSEAKESFPKCSTSSLTDKFDTDSIIEKPYTFQRKDTINQPFNDTINRGLSEFCAANDFLPGTSMNCTLNQQNDVQSSQKYTCIEPETSPLVIKQSLDSYDLSSSTDLASCSIDASLQSIEQRQEKALEQNSIRKNVPNRMAKQKVENGMNCRPSKRSPRCKKTTKMKQQKWKELVSSVVEPNQNELSLRRPQITVINPLNYEDVQDTCESPLSTFHMYSKKPPQTVRIPNKIQKQLKRVGIQQLRNISQRKQQILLNFHEDTRMNKIFNEDSPLDNSQCIMEDIISEDSNASCVSETLSAPENQTCTKFSKTNLTINSNVANVKLVTEKDMLDISNNIVVKSGTKWPMQNINAQPSKFIEEKAITKLDEDAPLKRRRLTPKFSSSLKRNTVVCTVNQQKIQNNHFGSTKELTLKKGIICTNRRKNMVGE